MATKKPTAKTADTKVSAPIGNLGTPADAPINPAIDPSRTAQERLDALDAQHREMSGLPPKEPPPA